MRLVTLLVSSLSLALPVVADAQWISEEVNPSSISPIEIEIYDEAIEGCWTNIGEAKRYAEDKLQLRGFTVAESARFTFRIHALSGRNRGGCYGFVKVEIYQIVLFEGVWGFLRVGNHGGIFSGYPNANNVVLEYVREIIEALPPDDG